MAFLAAVILVALRANRALDLDALLNLRVSLHALVERQPALALLAYLGLYVTAVTVALPCNALLSMTGGVLFGAALGGSAAIAGATIGAGLLFSIVRALGRPLATTRIRNFQAVLRRNASFAMLALRFSPVCPFWLVTLGAGAADIPLRTFLWTTAVGVLPITSLFALAGQNLDALAAASHAAQGACQAEGLIACPTGIAWAAILTPSVFVSLIGLSAFAVLPIIIRTVLDRRREQAAR